MLHPAALFRMRVDAFIRATLAATAVALAPSVSPAASSSGRLFGPTASPTPGRPVVHPTRVLARYRDEGLAVQATGALAAQGLRVVHASALVPGLVLIDADSKPAQPASSAAPADLAARIAALRSTGLFAYVEADPVVSIDLAPDDASLADGSLWGLHNMGQHGGTPGIDVDALRAWDITTGSTDVIVAVIDTGIAYTHVDLRAQMWRNPGETPANQLDDDGNGWIDDVFGCDATRLGGDPLDDHNHGTHVAGTIGAAANNGHPHVGVAWQVRLMACKFLNAEGWGFAGDAVLCIDYATLHGADIINASWGGGAYSQALVDSIAAAGDAGVLFVAAAGNSGMDLQSETGSRFPPYPAGYDLDSIVAVAAIDRAGTLASFSNFGRRSVDLGAPGVDIHSSTALAGKYGYDIFSGTSMAAPHVAGVAALARARHPDLDVRELKALLLHTTTPTPSLADTTVSGGRVNAWRAVTAAPDGTLEILLGLPSGDIAYAGATIPVTAHVTDLHGVPGATVTGLTSRGTTVGFRDDGIAPDDVAGDARFAAVVSAPDTDATFDLTVTALSPGRQPAQAHVDLHVRARPANDAFAAAVPIEGHAVVVDSDSAGATLEPGEPAHAGEPGGASVWWTWTAPADCEATIHVWPYQLDSLLAVYTGEAPDALVEIASNNDISPFDQSSRVTFPATSGKRYRIAVDGWGGAGGRFQLQLTTSAAAGNDAFAARRRLEGTRIQVSGTTQGATIEPGEASSRGIDGGSVWYTWTAPAAGTVVLDHLDLFGGSSTAEVYTGDAVATLAPVTNLTTSVLRHWRRFTFRATAGTAYQIALRQGGGESGLFQIELTLRDPPANDDFSGRIPIAGGSAEIPFDNQGATRETLEPALFDCSNSIWYSWTAPRSGTAVFNARSDFSVALAAYTGDAVGALSLVAMGDQEAFIIYVSGRGTTLVFGATAGTTYAIVVDGIEAGIGTGILRLDLVEPPANDLMADATVLSGESIRIAATNRGALGEPGEPAPYMVVPPLASVWWRHVATRDGYAVFTVETAQFRPLLRVYDSTSGSPVPIYSTDINPGRFVFETTAGSTYQLSVDGDVIGRRFPWLTGPDGVRGDFVLGFAVVDPPNDTFARRRMISGASVTTTGSNVTSRGGPNEPSWDFQEVLTPLWWSWTAPETGRAVFSTAGSSFDTVLGVFTGDTPSAESRLGANDDDPFGRLSSELSIPVQAGANYHILVDGYAGAVGDVALSIACAPIPANDAFAERAALAEPAPNVTGTNRGASAEPGEANHALVPASASVWWGWIAPDSGEFEISTRGSDFDTTLGVYRVDAGGPSHPVAANDDADDSGVHSRALFRADAGRAYAIAVDGYRGDRGEIALALAPHGRPLTSIAAPAGPAIAGSSATLHAAATGKGPFTYQWRRNGVDIAGAHGATLTLPVVQRFQAGRYTVVVTGASGPAESAPVDLDVAIPQTSPAVVTNLSARALHPGGGEALIPGFVVAGTGTRRLLLRAVGPELIPFGIDDPLDDPQVRLMRRTGDTQVGLATNDDWQQAGDRDAVRAAEQSAHAFPLADGSRSAALLVDLPAGVYTLVTTGVGNAPGVAIVELYDVGSGSGGARLANLSNRGFVGRGHAVMVQGFVAASEGPATFLLRAVGPTLRDFGIDDALADPRLHLHRRHPVSGAEEQIAVNDTWGENGDGDEIAAVAAAVAAFPLPAGSADAAVVVTLPPGIYTAVTTGVATPQGGDTGVVLVEVYLVP